MNTKANWNFLQPRIYEIDAPMTLDAVHNALSRHIGALPVRKNWLDFRTDRISSDYSGSGTRFTIRQRINMGRNDITVTAEGEGWEMSGLSRLRIRYVVGPQWLVGFLWLFCAIGVCAGITMARAAVTGGFHGSDTLLLLVPAVFVAVPLVINFTYTNQIHRLHAEVLTALQTRP